MRVLPSSHPLVHSGRVREQCPGCKRSHGGVNELIACLVRCLDEARTHPDRLRGQQARESFEAWAKYNYKLPG